MNVHIVPATVGGTPGQPLSCYIVDGTLAVDAGSLGFHGTVAEQARVEHVLLTHSHVDHVAGLPMFLDNIYGAAARRPTVYGSADTLSSLQSDLFNGRLMPDFIGMSACMPPFLAVREIAAGERFAIGRYVIEAVEVKHSVPTLGFVVDDASSAFALFTDTCPVPDVLSRVATHPRLKAVFLECSFPRRLAKLAGESCHLTTDWFDELARSLPQHVRVYPIHIKPQYHADVVAELRAFGRANVIIAEPGSTVEV